MKRRRFLQKTAEGLTALAGWPAVSSGSEPIVTGAESGASQDIVPDDYHAPDWLRYARVVYFDGYAPPLYPHIKGFDAKRLVDAVVELGGDTLRFQPVGFRAYYPSKAFPVHPELGNRDLIEEVARECRKSGVHLYCYTVFGVGMMDLELARRQPQFADWFLRDPSGQPYGIWNQYGLGESYYVHLTGDAYREALRNMVRELCAHDTDGVYFDAPSAYRGICFCAACRKNFRQSSGMDLDRLRNLLDVEHLPGAATSGVSALAGADMEALVAWYEWSNKLTGEDLLEFRKIIHGSGKFMLCHNGGTWRPGALYTQYRIPEGFMVEYSDQTYQRMLRGMMGASLARPRKKLAQVYMGSYDVQSIGQPANCKPWSGHAADLEDTDEVRMEGFVNLAGGNMPIYAVANRLLFGLGDGSRDPVKEVFALTRRLEPLMKDSVPVPYVSVVPTWESLELWRTQRENWNVMMSEGFLLAMLDERISCDVNPSLELTSEWLRGQRVIALCGASGLSDENAERLAGWVREGGALLATYDSGLYDARGQVRRDGGALKEVLGVEMKGEPLVGQADAFYRLKRTHPALAPYQEGAVVMADPRLVPAELRPGATLLADYWNFDREVSRGPAIVLNTYGKGRAIYVSGSLEANYASSRVPSLQRLLGSMVRYLAGEAPAPFRLTAPKGVYGLLRRAPSGDLTFWVLANVGFKDATVGRMRQEFVPVSNLTASVLVPEGRKVKSVELLRAGQTVPFSVEGGYVVFTLPTVHIAEVVHVALA
jgi:hypothetical protein